MATLGSALNIALTSLQANQVGLSVLSNNIANANTPGYSRERVLLQAGPEIGDTIRVGTGVSVTGTEAIRDQLVEKKIWNETSAKSGSDMTQQSLSSIETMFNESGNTGLLPLVTDFYNSFQKLSTNPSSADLRQQVTSSAASMTQFINARASDLQDLKTSTDQSIKDDVSNANTLISQIATISKSIQETENAQQPANTLRDQRTTLIGQLSTIMDVKELDSGNGSYQLTTGGNSPLVIGGTAIPLKLSTSSSGLTSVVSGSTDITSEFTSGTLAAHISLRDTSIPKYQQSLDQIAYNLANQVNQVHSVSYDQDGNTGTNFFTPIASVAGAAMNLQVNPAVAADSRKVAASSQSSGSDNEAAIALGNLINAPNSSGGTIVDQYSALVYQIGSETSDAQNASDLHDSMLTQMQNLRSSISGVSVDEETASVLQFQRAFQASARMVTTVDELIQTALAMGSGT